MSRNVGERTVRRCFVSALALVVIAVAPVSAQKTVGGIELSRSVSRHLLHLQEDWLQWMGAYNKDDAEEGQAQVDDMLASLRLLGLERLPDLSLGASVRAVESARQGKPEQAAWAVETAELLDEGRPETSFARSVLAWESGSTTRALSEQARGYVRLFDLVSYRVLFLSNLVLAAFSIALLAGGGFVVLQMMTKGAAVFRTLAASLSRFLPGPLGSLVAVAALLWPLVLPNGIVWLLVYWSILLWGSASVSERIVVTAVWVAGAVLPVVVTSQERYVTVELSPPSHAMRSLSEGRLYGSLFSDLGVLLHVLPDHPAVHHVLGDLHRTMGEWERARAEYLLVLEQEPENATALIDVGTYYFRKSDYGTAIRYFQLAAASDSSSPAPHFNLSQAYSESLLFEDRESALRKARALNSDLVGRWLQEERRERVVTFDGGFERQDEIRELLAEAWSAEVEGLALGRWLPLGAPIVALALAFAFMRISEGSAEANDAIDLDRGLGRVLRIVVPGLSSVDDGAGVRGFLAVAVLIGLVAMASGTQFGYTIPWGVDPGGLLPTSLAIGGLVLFFGGRAVWELRLSGR